MTNNDTNPTTDIVQKAKNPDTQLKIGGRAGAIMPQSIDEAAMLATNMVFAGMIPSSYEGKDVNATKAKVLIGILKGMEVGLPPITAINSIVIVNNRPSLWGDGALALVQNSSKYDGHTEKLEGTPFQDDWTATCTIKRKGVDEPYVRTFTYAQAKKAGISGRGVWAKYPDRMMQMRARAFALRDGFADVMQGLSIAEEMRDVEQNEKPAVDENAQLDEFTQQALLDKTNEHDDAPDDIIEHPEKNTDGETTGMVDDSVSKTPENETQEDLSVADDKQTVVEKPVCETCNGKGCVKQNEGQDNETISPCDSCKPQSKTDLLGDPHG